MQALTATLASQGSIMRTYLDAKLMAKTLRDALAQKSIPLSHSETLEIVAQQFGLADWNILAAKLNQDVQPAELPLPQFWEKGGRNPEYYQMGVAQGETWLDQPVAIIQSFKANEIDQSHEGTFGTLCQHFNADLWRGKKIALSGWLKSKDAFRVQMWMRIDGHREVLGFDNMDYRGLNGTCEWTAARIVLFVPDNAMRIHFGFFVSQHGTGWGSGFKIEEASLDEADTTGMGKHGLLDEPKNLDFSNLAN
jgi:hypothetical protein